MTKFILFMNLDMVDRNSAPEEFACIWQSKWVGIITIETEKMWVHSSCDVFVVVSCRGILNSLIFTKAWSMQAWIPVVSSSLYFWKSVFSFRADSILKSDGDFISNWKFPDCVHFFGAWTRQAVIETIAVVYDSRKELRRNYSPIGHNNTRHFLCPIRSRHPLEFLEIVRGAFARTWKLSSHLFSRPDWLPLGLRVCVIFCS